MEWYKQIRDNWFIIGHDPKKWETFLPRMERDAIERECEKASKAGYNTIQPSIAHYRWNFLEHIKEISEFIGDVCEVAHSYNLRVWEHHSVVLAYPEVVAGLKYKKWKMDELTKIDLRTGEIYECPKGVQSVFCANNPLFQEAYFDLIENMFLPHPVDLYMPDDMAWSDDYGSCGCVHCRELFEKTTGFTLPPNGKIEDLSFYGNMENPAWRAWIRFRTTKNGLFLPKLREFLRSKGRSDLLITTCNSDTLQNFTGRIQGTDHQEYNEVGGLDIGIHEIWDGESLTYNGIRNFADQSTNVAIGRRLGMPYFAFTYPRFNEEAVYDSARNMLVGMGSGFGGYLDNGHQTMVNFAAKNNEIIFDNEQYSNVGLVFSRNTRDFYGDDIKSRSGMENHCDEFGGWCEGLVRMNMPVKIITDSHIEDNLLSEFKVIILPNCACMSKKMVENLEGFVANGGSVIATHETSLYRHDGNIADDFQLSHLFGLKYQDTFCKANYPYVQNYSENIGGYFGQGCTFVANNYEESLRDALFDGIESRRIRNYAPMVASIPFESGCQVLGFSPIVNGPQAGFATVTCNEYGKGRVFYFAGLPGLMNNTRSIHAYDLYGEGAGMSTDERLPEYQHLINNIVNIAVANDRIVKLGTNNDNILLNLKKDAFGNCYLHLLNMPIAEFTSSGLSLEKYLKNSEFDINAGTGDIFGNPNKDPKFWEPKLNYSELGEIKLILHPSIVCSNPQLLTIDSVDVINLHPVFTEQRSEITIPKGAFRRYAIVKL